MQKFCFVVTDDNGRSKAGTVMAEDIDEVVEILRKSSLVVTEIWQPDSVSCADADVAQSGLKEALPSGRGTLADGLSCGMMAAFLHITRGFFRLIFPSLQF